MLALRRLRQLSAGRHEIDPSDAVREAAAFLGSERRPASLEMITLDNRLATAARKEGFTVIDLAPAVRLARMPATRKVYP